MKYLVLENGIQCDCHGYDIAEGWENSKFNTYDEARAYLDKWMGHYQFPQEYKLEVNIAYDYGYGDIVEIREVNE